MTHLCIIKKPPNLPYHRPFLFVLIGIFECPEVDSLSNILRSGNQSGNLISSPHIRIFFVIVACMILSPFCQDNKMVFQFFFRKFSCYLIRSFSLNSHAINSADYFSGFFINNQWSGFLGLSNSVWWDIACMSVAGRTSGFQYSFNFSYLYPDKPLIHDIQKRGKLTGFLTVTVNTIIDCYKSNFLFSKQNVSEKKPTCR